jgi:hypothetical protein
MNEGTLRDGAARRPHVVSVASAQAPPSSTKRPNTGHWSGVDRFLTCRLSVVKYPDELYRVL